MDRIITTNKHGRSTLFSSVSKPSNMPSFPLLSSDRLIRLFLCLSIGVANCEHAV